MGTCTSNVGTLQTFSNWVGKNTLRGVIRFMISKTFCEFILQKGKFGNEWAGYSFFNTAHLST